MKLIFLGTNGWYATSTGNTICILLETQKYFVVFDAGDGIYKLDQYLTSEKPIYLFLSHFHFDHIYGFHIFDKFKFKNPLTIFGQPGTEEILGKIICHPYTVDFKELKRKVNFQINFQELKEGNHDRPKTPFPVECRYLVHADPCFGYKLAIDRKIISFCTDTGICDNLIKLAQGADVLITECSLKKAEVDDPWPHLDPKKAAVLAKEAGVKKLFLVHFDASVYTTLGERRKAEKIARKIFPRTTVALDDMEIDIFDDSGSSQV